MADWITTTEAVRLSGYHIDYIRKLIKAGKIKGQKWGQQWQVSRSSLLVHMTKTKQLGAKRGPKTAT